jgi:hypothetical protein
MKEIGIDLPAIAQNRWTNFRHTVQLRDYRLRQRESNLSHVSGQGRTDTLSIDDPAAGSNEEERLAAFAWPATSCFKTGRI